MNKKLFVTMFFSLIITISLTMILNFSSQSRVMLLSFASGKYQIRKTLNDTVFVSHDKIILRNISDYKIEMGYLFIVSADGYGTVSYDEKCKIYFEKLPDEIDFDNSVELLNSYSNFSDAEKKFFDTRGRTQTVNFY